MRYIFSKTKSALAKLSLKWFYYLSSKKISISVNKNKFSKYELCMLIMVFKSNTWHL